MDYLYHGSIIENIEVLEARSKLHSSDSCVVYLTSSIPYALVYIWNAEKNNNHTKHVTCGIRDGEVFYEEKFPNQLETFYKGVSGYLYCVDKEDTYEVNNREYMYYSLHDKVVVKKIFVLDVYEELLKYEAMGAFKVYRYNEQTAEKKQQFLLMNAYYFIKTNFFDNDLEQVEFYKKYYHDAWDLALKEKSNPDFLKEVEEKYL